MVTKRTRRSFSRKEDDEDLGCRVLIRMPSGEPRVRQGAIRVVGTASLGLCKVVREAVEAAAPVMVQYIPDRVPMVHNCTGVDIERSNI